MTYKAFISYSHAVDGRLAPALQSALHHFAKPWYRLRAMRIFRDKTSLAMTPGLWPSIEKALAESEYLLLMASPQAAQSEWVRREIAWWIDNRPSRALFLLLTDGELTWDRRAGDFDWTRTTALPNTLTSRFADEPLYVDLRWAKTVESLSLRHSQFRAAVLDIAAALLNRPKDELDGEDVRQHRRTKLVAWSGAVAIAAFAVVASWQAYVARQRYRVALSRQLAAESINLVDSQPDLSLLLAAAASTVDDTVEARSALLHALEASPLVGTFLYPLAGSAYSVAFSRGPGGKMVSGHYNGEVIVWDVQVQTRIAARLRSSANPVRAVALAPDGRTVAAGDNRGAVRLWDTATGGQPTRQFTEHDAGVNGLAFSQDGRWLASVGDDSRVVVAAIGQGHGPEPLRLNGILTSVDASPSGSVLAIGSEDGTVTLWNFGTGRVSSLKRATTDTIRSVAFSPNGELLATGGDQGTIVLWDLRTRPVASRTLSGRRELWAVAFSPDGQTLVAAGNERTVAQWDVATLEPLGEPLKVHGDTIYGLAFSADGRTLASSDRSGRIVLWHLLARESRHKHTDEAWAVAFSPDGRKLVSGSKDKTLIISDMVTRDRWALVDGHADGVSSVVFTSHDGRRLASAGQDFAVVEWDVGPPQRSHPLTRDGTNRLLVAVPEHNLLISGSTDGRITRWNMATGQSFPFDRQHDGEVLSLTISGDGRTIASVDESGQVYLWDVTAGRWSGSVAIRDNAKVKCLAFSPVGQLLAAGDDDGGITLWDMSAPQRGSEHVGRHGATVKSLAFSQDGTLLASGDGKGAIILWDVQARQQIGPELAGHGTKSVNGLAFQPGVPPAWLASASDDTNVLLWDLSLGSWQRRACGRANRDLSSQERHQYLGYDSTRAICAR